MDRAISMICAVHPTFMKSPVGNLKWVRVTLHQFKLTLKLLNISYGKPKNPVTFICDETSHKKLSDLKQLNLKCTLLVIVS